MVTDTQESTTTSGPESSTHGPNMTTVCTNNPEKCEIKFNDKIIRLYFLRYGLFPIHNKEEHLISPNSKEGEEQESPLPALRGIDAPSLEYFYVGITALNSGYLYMFADDDDDLFYEYKLHADGRAQTIYEPVYIDKNKKEVRVNNSGVEKIADNRNPSGQYEVNKEFDKDQVLWIGYSQVEWTGEHYKNMIGVTDSEREDAGMIKVECKGFPEGSGQNHVLQQNEVKATFTENRKDADAWLDNVLGLIANYENNQNPEIKTDMFVVLPDPIGCARDMETSIDDELFKHQAFVESLRSGRDPVEVELSLRTEANPKTYDPDEQEQVAMVTLAQTIYQHIYTNPSMMENFANEYSYTYTHNLGRGEISTGRIEVEQDGVDKDKLETVLAKEERAEKRQLINNLQQDLANYVFDPYYMDAYHHDLKSDSYNILGSKVTATKIFKVLATNPHDIDRSFDLPNVQSLPMPWLENLNNTINLTDEYKIYEVLNFKLKEDDSIWDNKEDLANKFSDFVKETLEIFSRYTYKKMDIAMRTRVVPVADIYTEINKRLNSVGKVLDFHFQETYSTTFRSTGGLAGEIEVRSPRIQIVTEHTTRSEIAKFILDSKAFFIISNSIEIINLAVAIIKLSNDPSTKNTVAVMGAITEVVEAGLIIRDTIINRRGISALTKSFGVISIGITMIVSIMDVMDSHAERDTASAKSHSLAAASFGASMVLSVILGPLSLGVAVFLLAGFIFTFLGVAWTRSEMERFLQDFAFGTRGRAFPPKSIGDPWEYNREISDNHIEYANYGSSLALELHNFNDDLAWYMNRVIKARATITPSGRLNNMLLINQFSIAIEVNIPLSQQIINGLEIQAIYDMPGIGANNRAIPTLQVSSPRLNSDGTSILTEITLSENLLSNPNQGYIPNNNMMICFRFNIGQNKSFPFKMSNGKSYYYSIMQSLVFEQVNTKEAELIALEDFARGNGYGVELQIENIIENTVKDNLNLPNIGPQ